MRLRKYYWLEVQLTYFVNFASFLIRFDSHFNFLHSKLVLHPFESFIYFYLVLYLQLVGSQGAQNILPARGTARLLSGLCPIFTMLCSTIYFLHFKLQFQTLWNNFLRIHLNFCSFIWSSSSSWQDLRRLRKDHQLEVQLAYLVNFPQFLLRFAHFSFLHSKLV